MNFNVEETTQKIIEDIRDYYKESKAKGAIIGLSGGKDSAVAAGLLVQALGKDNVEAFWLPCYSKDEDMHDAMELAHFLQIKLHIYELKEIYEKIVSNVKEKENIDNDELLNNATINLKPRLRIDVLYFYAAYYSALTNSKYLVCGTSNKSELFVGYFTKGGDNVCDIAPIKHLYVDEVIKVGDYLHLPYHICHKIPNDGLSGKTDEEKLGFSYDDVKKVSMEMETGIIDDTLDNEVRNRIMLMHNANRHKFNVVTFRR